MCRQVTVSYTRLRGAPTNMWDAGIQQLLCGVQGTTYGIPASLLPAPGTSPGPLPGPSILYDLEGIRRVLEEGPKPVLRVKAVKSGQNR